MRKNRRNWDTNSVKESMNMLLFLKPIEITLFPWPLILPEDKAGAVLKGNERYVIGDPFVGDRLDVAYGPLYTRLV